MSGTKSDEFREKIDLNAEPWKTCAALCWGTPTPFRLGGQAEAHGITENPYTKPKTRKLFEEGRESRRRFDAVRSYRL